MKKNEVIKHSSAIHISNEINLLQRRAWNIMLAQAYNDLPKQDTYTLSVRELCDALGYKGNNDKHIKQILRDLVGIKVEWNLLSKDRQEWGVASLLAEVRIVNGVCQYAYSPTMRERLYNPSMYARISLSLQNQFGSKHSLALYELFVDYFDVSRGRGETPFIPVADFRRLVGLKNEEYQAFRDLNKLIIKKALQEINEISDLLVTVEYKRQGRSVSAIKFTIEPNHSKQQEIKPLQKKMQQLTLLEPEDTIANKELFGALVEEFGISRGKATDILKTQDEFYIEEVLAAVRSQIEAGKVQNIPAFTVKAIENDYRSKAPKSEMEKIVRVVAVEKRLQDATLRPSEIEIKLMAKEGKIWDAERGEFVDVKEI